MNDVPLTPYVVRYAYARGAFPMTLEDGQIGWFQPKRRALFPLEGIRVSRSLQRVIRRGAYEITFDQAFEEVMRRCIRPEDNWISEEFVQVYTAIHREGWGHSAECWFDGELVGGVYGVALGSCFCAESMFYRRSNASKVALWALVNRCRELGFTLFDAQIMNPHLRSLGAFEVPHEKYIDLLHQALRRTTPWSEVS